MKVIKQLGARLAISYTGRSLTIKIPANVLPDKLGPAKGVNRGLRTVGVARDCRCEERAAPLRAGVKVALRLI